MQILTHLGASHWVTQLKLPFLLDAVFITGVPALVVGGSADIGAGEQFMSKIGRQT